MATKTILVTGATRGIGRAVAEELISRGHRVYGGARSWKHNDNPSFEKINLDLTDHDSINDVVEKIKADTGRLDVLVNNAGISHAGSIEETSLDVARSLFETNYIGLTAMVQAVIPTMREQGGGQIVNVGSAAGRIGIPFQSHYAASKFAVEGLSESMFHELKKFGIKVVLIEPGDVATTIWSDNEKLIPDDSPYKSELNRFYKVKDKEMGSDATPVEQVGSDIADIIEKGSFRFRRPVAKMAELFMFARTVLPDFIFMPLVGKNYGIK